MNAITPYNDVTLSIENYSNYRHEYLADIENEPMANSRSMKRAEKILKNLNESQKAEAFARNFHFNDYIDDNENLHLSYCERINCLMRDAFHSCAAQNILIHHFGRAHSTRIPKITFDQKDRWEIIGWKYKVPSNEFFMKLLEVWIQVPNATLAKKVYDKEAKPNDKSWRRDPIYSYRLKHIKK